MIKKYLVPVVERAPKERKVSSAQLGVTSKERKVSGAQSNTTSKERNISLFDVDSVEE